MSVQRQAAHTFSLSPPPMPPPEPPPMPPAPSTEHTIAPSDDGSSIRSFSFQLGPPPDASESIRRSSFLLLILFSFLVYRGFF